MTDRPQEYQKLEKELLEAASLVRQAAQSGGATEKEKEIASQVQQYLTDSYSKIQQLLENLSPTPDSVSKLWQLFEDRRQFVNDHNEILERLAMEPLPELQQHIEAFQHKLSELETFVENYNKSHSTQKISLDWKLRYAAERDPEGKVEFKGGIIKDRFGKPIWQVMCYLCRIEIEHGAKGSGTPRFVDEECDSVTWCQDCWSMRESLKEKLGSTLYRQLIVAKDPHWDHLCFQETQHPVWLHVSILEAKTPGAFIHKALQAYKNRKCISFNGQWHSYQQILDRTEKIYAFLGEAIKKFVNRDRCLVGICSRNRPEWMISDFACAMLKCPVVGLHTTYTTEELEEIINRLELPVLITEESQLSTFAQLSTKCPSLKVIISIDDTVPPSQMACTFFSFPKMESDNQHQIAIDTEWLDKTPTDVSSSQAPAELFTIIFTSGSTGNPKGVMIPASAFLTDISHSLYIAPLVTSSFIPLSHSTDRMRIWECIGNGGRVGFLNYNPKNWEDHESGLKKASLLQEGVQCSSTNGVEELLEGIQKLRPTVFIAPSRIWTGLHNVFNAFNEKNPPSETLLERRKIKESASSAPKDENRNSEQNDNVEEKNFERSLEDLTPAELYLRQLLGGRVASVATGGSPTSERVMKWMQNCWFDAAFCESYGCTEAGGISMNGERLENVTVKVEPIEGATESTEITFPQIGELCVKTPVMALGYFADEKATKEAFSEGFFKTGDLGFVDEHGKVCITGRKKNLQVTAQGKVYDAEALESFYSGSSCIDQICIIGTKDAVNLIAVVIPNLVWVEAELKKRGRSVPQDRTGLKTDSSLASAIQQELARYARQENLEPHKIPSAVIVDTIEWSMENRMLTTSFKVVRNRVQLHYASLIMPLLQKLV